MANTGEAQGLAVNNEREIARESLVREPRIDRNRIPSGLLKRGFFADLVYRRCCQGIPIKRVGLANAVQGPIQQV